MTLSRATWCDAAAEGHRHRVLRAEDDVALRSLLTDCLRAEHYSVAARANGAEALEEARLWWPCLALVDLTMPGVDGTAFIAACRSDRELRELPILVASGAGAAVAALTVQGFVPKPFDLEHLLATVAATLGVSQPYDFPASRRG